MKRSKGKLTKINESIYMLNEHNVYLQRFDNAEELVEFVQNLLYKGEETFGGKNMSKAYTGAVMIKLSEQFVEKVE